MIGIYKIVNPIGEIYIGQSKNIRTRYLSHKNYQPTNCKLCKSMNDYGFEKHYFELLFICKKEELNSFEAYFIDKYKPALNSYSLKNIDYSFIKNINELNYKIYYEYKSPGVLNVLYLDKNNISQLINQLQTEALTKCANESLKSKRDENNL